MAGAGFDARMIGDADDGLKERIGRLSYVWTGTTNLRNKPFKATISVDGSHWFRGKASCLLVGNVGSLFGGLEVFTDARPDDGLLELGVVTADGVVEWLRTLARTAVGRLPIHRSSRRRRPTRSRRSSTGRSPTSSTEATGKDEEAQDRRSPGVRPGLCPDRGLAWRSHR